MLLLLPLLCLGVTRVHACDTGVAFVNSILSVPRSLMANADVAFLKTYNATALNQCLEECCSAKYGACSVASFKKNSSHENCLHFNCRPLHKCKFLSSNSTDSFTFSANPITPRPLPATGSPHGAGAPHTSKQPPEQEAHAKVPNTVDQFALKSDNTTVKPRKGVDNQTPDSTAVKSGVKPRKGVSTDDVPHSKLLPNSLYRSNVKPRKGVGPYSTTAEPSSSDVAPSTSTNYHTSSMDFNSTEDDVMFDLGKVFEDDTRVSSDHTTTESQTFLTATTTVQQAVTKVSDIVVGQQTKVTQSTAHPVLHSSTPSSTSSTETSASRTPTLQASTSVPTFAPTAVEELVMPPASTSTSLASSAAAAVFPDATTDVRRLPETETLAADYKDEAVDEAAKATEENDRRYKSSIHLVLSLVFGLLVLFAVLGVAAKRIYDGWVRRDYYRMNYLIDGIYNGVE